MERTSFIPGVLLAIKEVSKHSGLTVGLERLLGL
jgi:4-hydroxy-tetrahydrodipicolinate reductase